MPVNRNPKKDTKFREPTFDEIKACSPRLLEFINIVQPSLIVMMGNVAEKSIRHLTNGGIGNGYLKIQHPSWMQRTGQDTDKEIKGAVLSILSRCKKLGIPGFDQPLFQ
jgi:uracil-DNA glycosylase family 4